MLVNLSETGQYNTRHLKHKNNRCRKMQTYNQVNKYAISINQKASSNGIDTFNCSAEKSRKKSKRKNETV